MKTISRFFAQAWRPLILVASLALTAYLLYFHRLGSLLPGYAHTEIATYNSALTWHQIVGNPLNAPYKLTVLGLEIAGHHSPLTTRVAAAVCGIVAVVAFYCIARAWFGFRMGFLGALLFATSAGFLHVARLGTPQVLQLGIVLLAGVLVWHRRAPKLHPYLSYLVVLAFGVLWYVPGMVWFELILGAVAYRSIARHWQRTALVHRVAWIVLALLLAVPLAAALVQHNSLILPALGLPSSLHSVASLPANLLKTILAIGVSSDGNPLLWVGHSPLLNVMELIMGALGVYHYVYQQRSQRGLMLIIVLAAGLLLASLGGGVGMACILPILYLFITGGVAHLLSEWLTVFPRNPIARGVGVGIICAMLAFSIWYQTRTYFVAWPHNTATRQAFNLPRS